MEPLDGFGNRRQNVRLANRNIGAKLDSHHYVVLGNILFAKLFADEDMFHCTGEYAGFEQDCSSALPDGFYPKRSEAVFANSKS
jgi:hypothetical protein